LENRNTRSDESDIFFALGGKKNASRKLQVDERRMGHPGGAKVQAMKTREKKRGKVVTQPMLQRSRESGSLQVNSRRRRGSDDGRGPGANWAVRRGVFCWGSRE